MVKYVKAIFTATLKDGRKITHYVSDPSGISIREISEQCQKFITAGNGQVKAEFGDTMRMIFR